MIKKILKSSLFLLVLFSILASSVYAFDVPTAEYTADAYDTLLIHWNEADGNTTPDDASASNHTITNNGNAQTDSGRTKFGNTSLLDGTGDYWSISGANMGSDEDMGSGNFTIDCWVYWNSVVSNTGLFGNNNTGLVALYYATPYISFDWDDDVSYHSLATTFTPTSGSWNHYAVVRNGADLKIYIDGTQSGNTFNISTNTLDVSSAAFYVGFYGGGYGINGWIEEFRMSKGIARDWAAAVRRIMTISYGIDIGSPNIIGTPLWSCKIKLEGLWRNFAWKYLRG